MTTVSLRKENFNLGLKYAKKVGGKYNSADKTWSLPDTGEVQRMLNAPAAYGWIVVKAQPVSADSELGIDDPAFWANRGQINGSEIVNMSIFGKIDSNAITTDGRNIGQMQIEMAQYLDTVIGRIPQAVGQMNSLQAEVAIEQVLGQALRRKLWGANELEVFVVRNGQKAIQGVKAHDIIESVKSIVRNAYPAESKVSQ